MEQDIVFFKHKPGDGLHYVNDNFKVFDNGDYQLGDTSEGCALLNLHRLATAYRLPPLWELWSLVYPSDPMTLEDGAYIIDAALDHTEQVDPLVPDNKEDILADVRAVGYPELAHRAAEMISQCANDRRHLRG